MEHKQTVTEVKESRLSVKQKVLFGMGDYLNTITYGMISAFLMAFLTDTLLIPMAAVTAIMSLSKLWDAINDPVIGVIIDKSRSPKGVYRPWLIRMMVPFALSNILLWLPIGHWSTSAKITVVSIVYCLYMVWQLYRSEFFTFSLVTATAGVVFFLTARTSYMANRIGGSILLALILIGTALVVFLCAKNRGRLTIGGKTLQLFPDGFNSLLFYFICVLWAIVLIACLLFGSGFAYYAMFAAIAVELIGAVYYTFQLK